MVVTVEKKSKPKHRFRIDFISESDGQDAFWPGFTYFTAILQETIWVIALLLSVIDDVSFSTGLQMGGPSSFDISSLLITKDAFAIDE